MRADVPPSNRQAAPGWPGGQAPAPPPYPGGPQFTGHARQGQPQGPAQGPPPAYANAPTTPSQSGQRPPPYGTPPTTQGQTSQARPPPQYWQAHNSSSPAQPPAYPTSNPPPYQAATSAAPAVNGTTDDASSHGTPKGQPAEQSQHADPAGFVMSDAGRLVRQRIVDSNGREMIVYMPEPAPPPRAQPGATNSHSAPMPVDVNTPTSPGGQTSASPASTPVAAQGGPKTPNAAPSSVPAQSTGAPPSYHAFATLPPPQNSVPQPRQGVQPPAYTAANPVVRPAGVPATAVPSAAQRGGVRGVSSGSRPSLNGTTADRTDRSVGENRDKHYASNHPFDETEDFLACDDAPPNRPRYNATDMPPLASFRPRPARLPVGRKNGKADPQKFVIGTMPFPRLIRDGSASFSAQQAGGSQQLVEGGSQSGARGSQPSQAQHQQPQHQHQHQQQHQQPPQQQQQQPRQSPHGMHGGRPALATTEGEPRMTSWQPAASMYGTQYHPSAAAQAHQQPQRAPQMYASPSGADQSGQAMQLVQLPDGNFVQIPAGMKLVMASPQSAPAGAIPFSFPGQESGPSTQPAAQHGSWDTNAQRQQQPPSPEPSSTDPVHVSSRAREEPPTAGGRAAPNYDAFGGLDFNGFQLQMAGGEAQWNAEAHS